MTPGKRDLKREFEELRRERAERAERGVLPRAIERQHKFPFNERPDDPDADPASPWLYAKGWEVDAPPPAGPTIVPIGGPDSGVPCQRRLCDRRLRIVDEFSPGEILTYVSGGEEQRVVVEGDVNILILACVCGYKMQFRSDMLPNRTRLVLP